MKTVLLLLITFNLSAQTYNTQLALKEVNLGLSYKYNPTKSSWDYDPRGYDYDDFVNTSINHKTIIAYSLATLSGISWGLREIYHKDPSLLQNYYNQADRSFIGKDAWLRQYYGWTYPGKHKPEYGLNMFRDLHHATGAIHTVTIITSTGLIWSSSYPKRYKVLHTLGIILTRSLVANIVYSYYTHTK